MRFFRVWVVLAALSGCSSGGEDDAQQLPNEVTIEEATLRFCNNECERIAECGRGDVAICNAECNVHRGLRSEVLLDVAECVRSMPCERFDTDDPAGECFDSVSAALPLTESVLDYCERTSSKDFSCTYWLEVDDCARFVGRWRDEVLADVQSTCQPVECWKLEDCYTDAFEKYR